MHTQLSRAQGLLFASSLRLECCWHCPDRWPFGPPAELRDFAGRERWVHLSDPQIRAFSSHSLQLLTNKYILQRLVLACTRAFHRNTTQRLRRYLRARVFQSTFLMAPGPGARGTVMARFSLTSTKVLGHSRWNSPPHCPKRVFLPACLSASNNSIGVNVFLSKVASSTSTSFQARGAPPKPIPFSALMTWAFRRSMRLAAPNLLEGTAASHLGHTARTARTVLG